MRTHSQKRYHAYLLRTWQEEPDALKRSGGWRFSLQDTATGERRGFASLDDLITHLRAEMAESGKESNRES